MKNIIIILIIFLSACASVELTEQTNVIDLPGQSKQQIYNKSVQWITYKFVSGRAVMDYKDPSVGRIIAKGSIPLDTFMASNMTAYIIGTIDCVNGRAKIAIKPDHCQVQSIQGTLDCECSMTYITPKGLKRIPDGIIEFVNDYTRYMVGGNAPAWDGKN